MLHVPEHSQLIKSPTGSLSARLTGVQEFSFADRYACTHICTHIF